MTAVSGSDDVPTAEEIRAAVERIVTSDAFRRSPQLVSFLRFVVESVLGDKAESIKSYTIGVEAFGRGEDFDPQVDPIVRVEAGRMRRALACYFAGEGADLPVTIEIPLGSYIPKFRRRKNRRPTAIFLATLSQHLSRRFNTCTRFAAATRIALLCGLIIVGALAIFGSWSRTMSLTDANRSPASGNVTTVAAKTDRMPLVSVQPVVVSGVPPGVPIPPEELRSKLLEALARFDEIRVVMEPAAQAGAAAVPPELRMGRSNYRVGTTLEYRKDGVMRLSVLLQDAILGTVVWADTFDESSTEKNNANIEDALVGNVAAMLAQPYGVIYADEVAKNAANTGGARYGCLVQTIEFRRIQFRRMDNTGARERVRACLERATKLDPKFADGFAELSMLDEGEYYVGGGGDPALADRAVEAALRAVELKPQSARAHQALSNALFAHGDIAYALHHGEIAVALNPNDMTLLTSYGMRLAASGQLEKGAALLSQAANRSPVPSPFLNFTLFVCAYLLGDDERMSYYASSVAGDAVPLSLLVHALAAAKAGDQDRARQIIARLSEQYPFWRTEARRLLQRVIPSAAIVDRLARDLNTIGLAAER
jgi:Tfp pilus assembly protein PilF/TolB-like protein